MERVTAENYGLCQTPDGRSVPCNQLPGDGLAQLALMLRGSRMMDLGYGGNGSGRANSNLAAAANSQRPAYENSWASIVDDSRPFAPGAHLPITKAQDIFIAPSQPYIDTIPWRPGYLPFPPEPMPPESVPIQPGFRPFPVPAPPFVGPSRLGPHASPDEDWPFPDSEECEKEIDEARKICTKHLRKLKSGLQTGNFGYGLIQCMRGIVSEGCGGNPVQKGNGGKISA